MNCRSLLTAGWLTGTRMVDDVQIRGVVGDQALLGPLRPGAHSGLSPMDER